MSSDDVVVEEVGGGLCADTYQKYQIYQLLISAFEVEDGADDIEANAAVVSRLPQLEIYLHLFAALSR